MVKGKAFVNGRQFTKILENVSLSQKYSLRINRKWTERVLRYSDFKSNFARQYLTAAWKSVRWLGGDSVIIYCSTQCGKSRGELPRIVDTPVWRCWKNPFRELLDETKADYIGYELIWKPNCRVCWVLASLNIASHDNGLHGPYWTRLTLDADWRSQMWWCNADAIECSPL